jgi:hypothetical protein
VIGLKDIKRENPKINREVSLEEASDIVREVLKCYGYCHVEQEIVKGKIAFVHITIHLKIKDN